MLIVLSVAALAAQDKPNFAGTWKIVGDSGDMMVAPQMTVAQDAQTLTVTASTQMGEIKTVYNLDGSENKAPLDFNGTSIDRVTKAAWTGAKLTMTVLTNFNGQSFESKAVWSMNQDGTLHVETTRPDFQGGGSPVTSTVNYKKS